jgi:drug/metabolite transporter (DMT)-like permease
MVWGLVAALASAVCYGVASVLQAVAARRTPASNQVDPRVLVRVLRQVPFLAGLALDTLGFAFQFVALRFLPIFVVQSALAASLAVTAVVAIPVLGLRLGGRQWAAVGGVCVGLALLGLSAGEENPRPAHLAFRLALIPCVLLLALVGVLANRLKDPGRAVTLGLVAGLSFGVVAVAARSIERVQVLGLLRDPASYALIGAGAVAFLFYTIGLQRASVTTVTAGLVIGETVLPAIIGVLVFGDGTRAGFLPVAVAGFLLAIVGSLLLARYGDIG